MSERIYEALDRHFARHRIIFWYDPDARMRQVCEGYTRDGIERIVLANDEFRVKYRLIREEPARKFLVYSPRPRPAGDEDWLLDIALCNFVFSTDEAAMYIQDLGLSEDLKQVVAQRIGFFRATRERVEPLAALVRPGWGKDDLLNAMLSIASARTRSERQELRSIDAILISLCSGDDSAERWKQVIEWKLDHLFFELVRKEFGIALDTPEPRGILIKLFQNALAFQIDDHAKISSQRAFVCIDGWRDTKSETERFEEASRFMEVETNAKDQLGGLSDDRLADIDLYYGADRELLRRIVSAVSSGRADLSKSLAIIQERKNRYWYRNEREGTLRARYDALEFACLLERAVRSLARPEALGAATKEALWNLYTADLHRIDRLYRAFVLSCQNAGSGPELAELLKRIDGIYLNDFLEPVSLRWQSFLDASLSFSFAKRQNAFFGTWVDRFLRDNKPVFVIVSDGLRWEAGVELSERIQERNRFKVGIEPAVALVPTYTSHGMAALLPHTKLSLDPATSAVLIDGHAVNGIEGRSSWLAAAVASRYPGKKARAISAESILSMTTDEAESELREFDLVYVYSDHIDSASHASDSGVPMAVDREIERIIDLVRRITNLNRSNILVTADHGFLFSGVMPDDSHMLSVDVLDGESFRDRRFILGIELAERPGLGLYAEPEPAFAAGTQALVAKGLSKIRRKGGYGRYIHGGATLQEIAVPVLHINKTRQDDARRVDVSVLGSTDITSPSIALRFFQESPVGGKIIPHRIVSAFESATGESISSKADRVFDSTEESEMNRGVPLSFVFLPLARKYIGTTITLRLSTVAEGGATVDYKLLSFRLKQLALDVDFF